MPRKQLSQDEHLALGFKGYFKDLGSPRSTCRVMSEEDRSIAGPLEYWMPSRFVGKRGFAASARKLACHLVNWLEQFRDCHKDFWEACCWQMTRRPGSWVPDRWVPFPLDDPATQKYLFPSILIGWAGELTPFSEKTYREWAEILWNYFISISPQGHPSLHPYFTSEATQICRIRKIRKDSYFEGKEHSSLGVADNDLKEALITGFEEVATGRSRRTRQRRSST